MFSCLSDLNFIGTISSLGAAAAWAVCITCFTVATLKLPVKGPVHVMNFLRTALTLSICFSFFAASNEPLPSVSTLQWLLIFGGGVFYLGDILLYVACASIGPGLTSLFFGTYPIMTALLASVLFGDQISPGGFLGICITFFGVSWVTFERSRSRKNKTLGRNKELYRGILFAVGAALCQALSFLCLRPTMEGTDALSPGFVNMVRFLFAFIGFGLFIHFLGLWKSVTASFRFRAAIVWIAVGAVVGNVIGSWFSLIPFSDAYRIPSGVATALMSTIPVMILPLVILGPPVIRERVSLRVLLGVIATVVGVIVMILNSSVYAPTV